MLESWSAADRRAARRFGLIFVLTFLVTWSTLLAIHVIGNPDGLFPSSRNPSRRELAWKTRQLGRLVDQGKPPTVLVLGSSRLMQVSPPQLDRITRGGSTFNYASPGVTPRDMLAQLRHALDIGAEPTHVLIGVDDQAMFGLYDATHGVRLLMTADLFAQLPSRERLRILLSAPAQVKPHLTWQALRDAIAPPPFKVGRVSERSTLVLGDGYIVYPKREQQREAGTYVTRDQLHYKLEGHRKLGDGALLYPDGARISERQFEYFRRLLALCRRHGIRAYVVFTPSHPDYDAISLRPRDVEARRALSERLKELCHGQRARYSDCSSIATFNGDGDEFWDEVHPTPVNMHRMINVAFGLPPERNLAKLPSDAARIARPSPIHSSNTP
jgi:hypothetical protein